MLKRVTSIFGFIPQELGRICTPIFCLVVETDDGVYKLKGCEKLIVPIMRHSGDSRARGFLVHLCRA